MRQLLILLWCKCISTWLARFLHLLKMLSNRLNVFVVSTWIIFWNDRPSALCSTFQHSRTFSAIDRWKLVEFNYFFSLCAITSISLYHFPLHTYIQGCKFWVLSFGVLRRKRFHILDPNLAEEISRSQKHSMHTRKDILSISAHLPAKVRHQQWQSFVHTSIWNCKFQLFLCYTVPYEIVNFSFS